MALPGERASVAPDYTSARPRARQPGAKLPVGQVTDSSAIPFASRKRRAFKGTADSKALRLNNHG